MSKPVTYYIQTQPIESFMEKYGSRLESLTKPEKLFLQALISESLADGMFKVSNAYNHTLRMELIEDAVRLIQLSTDQDLTGLSLAIANQIHDKIYAQ